MFETLHEKMVAYHEAGHAVATIVLGFESRGIDLIEAANTRGTASLVIPEHLFDASKTNPGIRKSILLRLIMTYFAGPCTEMAFSNLPGSPGGQGDRQEAWNLAIRICDDGYENGILVDSNAQRIAMNALLERLLNRSNFLVRTRRFQRAAVALAAEGLKHGAVGPERTAEIVATALAKAV